MSNDQTPAPNRLRQIGEILGITLITLALIPITLEIGFRLIPQAIPQGVCDSSPILNVAYCQFFFRFDDPMRLGYIYKPGYAYEAPYNPGDPWVIGQSDITCGPPRDQTVIRAMKADDKGFRNPTPWQDQYDIVLTGDSFTQSYSRVFWLDELIETTGMSVLNLGMEGWGTLSEAEAVRMYGLDKNPRWVILLYYEGNDLFNVQDYQHCIETGTDWRTCHLSALKSVDRLVLPYVARYWWEGLSGSPQDPEPAECHYPMTVATNVNHIRTVFDDVNVLMLGHDREDILAMPGWSLATQAILALSSEVKSQGGRFLLVYLPTKEHIYWGRVWDEQEVNLLVSKTYPMRGFQHLDAHVHDQMTLMEEFTAAHDIEFLNLMWDFQAHALGGEELYYYADVHWTDAGNRLAAELIAKYLMQSE